MSRIIERTWFNEPGAYVLVDGQYGSTGKGLIAGYLAQIGQGCITHVTTNAGPNSGHTAYFDGEKIVTQQVPVASVFLHKMGHKVETLINAGAIVDAKILGEEVAAWLDYRNVYVHPCAALILPEHREADQDTLKRIASTGKGIGPAMMDKLARNGKNLANEVYMPMLPPNHGDDFSWDRFFDWTTDVVFVETAQGFSLGINQARFAPRTTSRECTVMQAIADARIPAQMVKKVIMTCRTYPIRVGNTERSSGSYYADQQETTWEEIGVEPELTTVTKRVRRVFTWSRIQFREAVAANMPDVIFLNFCNYISKHQLMSMLEDLYDDYRSVMGRNPDEVLLGFGPQSSDICTVRQEFGEPWAESGAING